MVLYISLGWYLVGYEPDKIIFLFYTPLLRKLFMNLCDNTERIILLGYDL